MQSTPGSRSVQSAAFSRTFWGGVTLSSTWMAVLFVGVFGGNVQTTSAGGDASSWPVVAVVALAALLATVSVARWAFRPEREDESLRAALDDQRRAIEHLTAELEELRTRLLSTTP